MRGQRHWFNQKTGVWPVLACGELAQDELDDGFTLYMSRVSCSACKQAIQASIERLRHTPSRFARGSSPATISGELANPSFLLHDVSMEIGHGESITSQKAGADASSP